MESSFHNVEIHEGSFVDTLDSFNLAGRDEARELLRQCVDIDRWVDDLADRRPYADVDGLLAAARTAADPWSPAEIDGALAHHPRIGERAAGSGTQAQLSRSEQSGVDPADADVAQALLDGNRAYEDKFGRVFLIRAAGRSAADILASLTSRLTNSPQDEIGVVAEQLREIALLRLEGALQS